MNRPDINPSDTNLRNTINRNRILGLLCLMGSGPFVALSFYWYTIANAPYFQLITIAIGLGLGAAGTFLLLSQDNDES